ncbi:glycosyltransferase [Pectobacterium versatile]|nr:glycosyltransferase [Pectobacterium versatile]
MTISGSLANMMIDIVVPVFNETNKTKLFIDSLSSQINHRLIIIDNGSDEVTQQYLQGVKSHVIRNAFNVGYTKGMNQGLAQIESEFVLFANNDIILPTHLLQRLLHHLSHYDIVAPLTNNVSSGIDNDNLQLIEFDSAKDEINVFSDKMYAKNKMKSISISRAYAHCLLMKREVIDKIGILDERFESGYHSDDDFCRRAISHGMKIGLALDCFVFHFCHTTFYALGVDPKVEMKKSQTIFDRKYK